MRARSNTEDYKHRSSELKVPTDTFPEMKVVLAVLLVALALAEARRSSRNHTEFMVQPSFTDLDT
jgi:hypothetical protein